MLVEGTPIVDLWRELFHAWFFFVPLQISLYLFLLCLLYLGTSMVGIGRVCGSSNTHYFTIIASLSTSSSILRGGGITSSSCSGEDGVEESFWEGWESSPLDSSTTCSSFLIYPSSKVPSLYCSWGTYSVVSFYDFSYISFVILGGMTQGFVPILTTSLCQLQL